MIVDIAAKYMGIKRPGIKEVMQYYNSNVFPLVKPSRRYRIQEGDEWCMCFASVAAHMAGIERFPWEVSTYYALRMCQEWGVATNDPKKVKRNDLVFYDWGGNSIPNHVGIVVNTVVDTLTVIEGNTRGTVGLRRVYYYDPLILSFATVNTYEVNEEIAERNRIEQLANEVIKGAYGNGEDRKRLLGDDYLRVQEKVNSMLAK